VLPAPEDPGLLRDEIAALLANPRRREAQGARARAGFDAAYALPAVVPGLAAAAAAALGAPRPASGELRDLLQHLNPAMGQLR
jgi:hypothetical protein